MFRHAFRTMRPYQLAVDLGFAFACILARSIYGYSQPALVAIVAGMAVSLGIRRWSPAFSLTIAWVTAVAQMALSLPPDAANLAILPVLFATSAYGSKPIMWSGLASSGLGAAIATWYLLARGVVIASSISHSFGGALWSNVDIAGIAVRAFIPGVAVFGLSWTLGLLVRTWAASRENEIARRIAERDAAVEHERTSIARDMHDVVAHSLAVVIAQADGARYAAASNPLATEATLATISMVAREALGDVRILLGQLRSSQRDSSQTRMSNMVDPQPALADLDRLFEQLRAAGLQVERSDNERTEQLTAGQQLAIYRIVQESLTNVLRHGADPKHAHVQFTWSPTSVQVQVSNAMLLETPLRVGAEPWDDGHGINGMRERAILAGGSLSISASADTFTVVARIPVTE